MNESGDFSDEGLDEFEESVEDTRPNRKVDQSIMLLTCCVICN